MTLARKLALSGTLRSFLLLSGAALFLASCGGGPIVATTTGHYLFVSNSSGIYSFSILSDNTLSPVSTSPQQPQGSFTGMAFVKTPAGTASPTLYATTGSSIWAFPSTGGGTIGTSVPVTLTSCSLSSSSITAITATPGGHYLLIAYGSSSSYSLAALQLTSGTAATCTPISSPAIASAPSGLAVDCAVLAGSPCNVLATVSGSAPYLATWTEGSTIGTLTQLQNISTNPAFALFSLSTDYFYLFSPSQAVVSSLTGSLTTTTAQTSSQTIPASTSAACLDLIANTVYVPTTGGAIDQMGLQANGAIGGAAQVWSLASSPALYSIGSCAVQD